MSITYRNNKINMTKIKENIKKYINKTLIPMISCDENVGQRYKWELHSITPSYFILRNYSKENSFDYNFGDEDENEFIRTIIVGFNDDGSWNIKSNQDINDERAEWDVHYKYFARSTQYFYALYQLMKHGINNELLLHLSTMYREWNKETNADLFNLLEIE